MAQLAAFLKLWLVARYFGVGTELDGYNLAFVGPSLIAGVLSAVVQTGLFPIYSELRVRRGEAGTAGFERALFWTLLSTGLLVSLVVLVFAECIAGVLGRDGTPALRQATVFVLRFAAFAIVLNAIGDFLGYVLALRGRFIVAATAPIANAGVGALLLLAWSEGGLANLAIGTLLGIAVQIVIVLLGAMSAGFKPKGSLPDWHDIRPDMSQMLRLGGWILPGTLFGNLSNALPPVMLVSFGEGAVSAFGYAFRLHQSAIQLAVMAVSPFLLSRFSALVAERQWTSLNRLQRKAFWASFAIGLVGLVFVAIAGKPLLVLLFGYGRFDVGAAERVAQNWILLTVGLGVGLFGIVLAKRMQAGKHARELSLFALLGLIALVATASALEGLLGEWSVPVAVAFGTLIPTLLMASYLRQKRVASAAVSKEA